MDTRLNMPTSLGQFTLKWLLEGQQCRNVMYMEFSDADTGDSKPFTVFDLEEAAGVLAQGYKNAYQALTSSSASLQGIDCVGNSTPGTGPLIETSDITTSYPIVGGNTGGGDRQ